MKQLLLLTLLFSLFFAKTFSQTGIAVPEMSHCDTQAINFLNTYNIPGMTYALTKNGKLVYSRAFGNADINGNEAMQPYHMLRVASVSKPITAIGIMHLVEQGMISLSDKVFGVGGLLENHWYFSTANITDNRVYDITVQHLLEHTAGWNRNVNCFPNPTTPYPWHFSGCDPIVAPLHVTQTFGEANPAKEEHLIRFVLEKTLDNAPGTTYAYSNMGFLILSEIIEEISGQDYEDWMQYQIFLGLGVYDMHIGQNQLVDKMEREGEYIGNGYTTKDIYGNGQNVPWEYGGMNVNAMDGHGGWIATARDLVRLLSAVDGFSSRPDILEPSTITEMATASSANQFYAKGWQVNNANNWWHTGAIDGTASILVRTSGEYTWAIVLNKRIVDGTSNAFWAALDGLGWNCVNGTTTFPTHDLFEAPTNNASALQVTGRTTNSMDLHWVPGNGGQQIVVAKEILGTTRMSSAFQAYPIDGTDYTANDQFGSGDDLGDGTFVVFNGTGNSMTLSGLNENSNYAIRVYDYKKNAANGNNALYLLGNAVTIEESPSSLGIKEDELRKNIKIYPNPTTDDVTVEVLSNIDIKTIEIFDVTGRLLKTKHKNFEKISLKNYSKGIYFIRVKDSSSHITKQIIKQ